MPEWRLFGPPGTGKTTALAKWIVDTCFKRGSDSLIAMSFTRTAAAEIAGRQIPLDKSRVGTLHAMAFRALGGSVVVDKDIIARWNAEHSNYTLTGGGDDIEEGVIEAWGKTEADKLYNQAQIWRAQLIPEARWPNLHVRAFYAAWSDFKDEVGAIDFTDMIEHAIRDNVEPPGNPSIIFVDEVQDLTRLEIKLARMWGGMVEHIVMAGDDDQSIYRFKGATPDAFLDPPVPEAQKRMLKQSYRVPYEVQIYAQAWVERLTRREPKSYAPRAADGCVEFRGNLNLLDPHGVVKDIEKRLAYTVPDGNGTGGTRPASIMVLTTCSYMLEPIKSLLRERGIPFENRYRRTRGDWNPLRPGNGVSTVERLLAYLAPTDRDIPLWTGLELARWTHMLKKTGTLTKQADQVLQGLNLERPVPIQTLGAILTEDALEAALRANTTWLRDNALAAAKRSLEFPLAVIKHRGTEALRATPQVTIGTIHSVKGGEADVVYVFPDVSTAGSQEWGAGGEARDALIRQFYVAFTRARDTLVVCGRGAQFSLSLPSALPKTQSLTI